MVLPPLLSRGAADAEQTTRDWFDLYASDIGYEVQEVEVRASGDLGFCSFVYHVSGTMTSGDRVSMWVRATLGLREARRHLADRTTTNRCRSIQSPAKR